MSDYNALVNLRFNRTSGPIDLVQNSWSSKTSGVDYTIDLVDYSSAGQFSGNCATFNGETSVITKVSGNYLLLPADQEFTISLWVNTNLYDDGICQILITDGDNDSNANKLYLYNHDNEVHIAITDRDENIFVSNDIKNSFVSNQWNYLTIIKFAVDNEFKLGIFLNGFLVSEYFDIINPINFDKVRTTIGSGYSSFNNRINFFEGKIDDIAIISNAIPIENDEVLIPTNYLISEDDEEDQSVWEDKEPEYSRYDDIIYYTEIMRHLNKRNIDWAQEGLLPYRIYPIWEQVDEMYFKNGEYYVNRDINSIKISVKNIWDNHFFVNPKSIRFLDTTFEKGYSNNLFNAAILFIDEHFIPWTKWHIVKSDKYITFIIDDINYKTKITKLEMLVIPTAVVYSEKGLVPNEGYRLFGFTENGEANGYKYVLSNTNSNLIVFKYRNMHKNETKKVDIDISLKLTDSNILIFEAGTNNEANPNFDIAIGNYFTILDEGEYDVYVMYSLLHNKSEDNITNIPNEKAIREYLELPYGTIDENSKSPVNLVNLHDEFDWEPTWNGKYNDKYYNSMGYIFNYNRNKYDKVYENIRPVNDIEISGKEFKTYIDENGKVTLSKDTNEKFDIKNDTCIMIFVNGVLPEWYQDIKYITHESIEFYPGEINDDDIIEVCLFRNIFNYIFKYNGEGYEIPFDDRYLYIPKDDLLVYTDRKGYLNLNPILYDIDELNSLIVLADEKYADYGIFIGSRRQFLYDIIPINKETSVMPIPYNFRTGYNPENYHLFLNGRLMDSAYYRIVVPSLSDNRVKTKAIYFVKPVTPNDRLELFYISGTCNKMNTSGDLVIKAIKAQASVSNQRKFLIPLPYSNYPIEYDTFMVMNKSIRMGTDKYKLSSENITKTITRWNDDIGDNEDVEISYTNYYIELMDQDDYLIPGEELTFLFPYYKAEWETIDEPTIDNTLQFITRYAKLTESSSTIKFPDDYMGNIEDSRFIYIFINTKLIDPKDYMISDVNTIVFNDNLPVGSEVAMVIETDRYNLKDNNVLLNFSNIVVYEYGQIRLELPTNAVGKEYIFFRNNLLLDSDSYTISGNNLLLDKNQSDLLPGDIITAVYATDGGTNSNTINFQSHIIKAIVKNSIDIPNFTNIRYTNNNILVFVNNEFLPNAYYKVSGNTITFIDNAYASIEDGNENIMIASNRGSDIVNINDEVTVFVAYKSINPNTINYDLGNKEFIRFTESIVKVTENGQTEFSIPYPSILSTPFRDSKFILFLRGGIFIPETDYTISEDNTIITIENEYIELRTNDELTFLFCHVYDFTDINKTEYSINLINGQNNFVIPSVYTTAIDLSNRIMLFYGGTYVDPSRYSIDRLTRTVSLKDIPGENDYNRHITVVFLYTGLTSNGSVAMLPQSGYICFSEHYIDRNFNKELYMLFVNGKKVPKSYIYDITNSIKKITVDIKSRYDLIALSTSPLITEFKQLYDDEEFVDYFKVTIEKVPNGVIEVTTGSGGVYYNSFTARYSEYFSVRYIPDRGYLPGVIYINGENDKSYGNVFEDITISADSGEAGEFRTVFIHQKEFETIFVKCNGSTYKDEFTDIKGSTIEIHVSNERVGYHTGNLTVTGTEIVYDENKNAYIGVIGDDHIDISIEDAIIDMIPFRVIDDNMYGQTLSVEFYNNDNVIIRTYTDIGTTINVEYGTRVKFILKSTDSRYKRGEHVGVFKVNNFYTIDYEHPFTDLIPESVAPIKRYYIDIKQNKNELLYVDTFPNVELIDSVQTKVRHIEPFYGSSNDIYTIGSEANYGYTAGTIIVSNDKLYGPIKESFSVSITPAILETVLFTIAKNKQAIGSITATLESGEIVGIGVYIVQKNSEITINTKVNGVITNKTFTITRDQLVTLDVNGDITFDPELDD